MVVRLGTGAEQVHWWVRVFLVSGRAYYDFGFLLFFLRMIPGSALRALRTQCGVTFWALLGFACTENSECMQRIAAHPAGHRQSNDAKHPTGYRRLVKFSKTLR